MKLNLYIKNKIGRCVFLFFTLTNRPLDLDTNSKTLQTYTPHTIHKERQKLLDSIISKELSRIFSDSKHQNQFDINDFDRGNSAVYNIVDHHDILNRDLFVTPNIVANFFRFKPDTKPKAIITITDSGIPVDHFGNKRGVHFDGQKINLFPHSKRHLSIYGAPKLLNTDLKSKNEHLKYIDDILESTSNREHILSYKDQVTATNRILWKMMFEKDLRSSVPELFHVPGETITSELLQIYLTDSTHPFYKILFDKRVRDKTLELFSTLRGCWDKSQNHGTHFFWVINNQIESERLWIEENKLVNVDRTTYIELNPQNIIEKLKDGTIYPNLFLVYGILIFHLGIKALSGGRSTNDIVQMKSKWLELQKEIPTLFEICEQKLIQDIPVGNTIQDAPRIPYVLDIIGKGGLTRQDLEKMEQRRINMKLVSKLFAKF